MHTYQEVPQSNFNSAVNSLEFIKPLLKFY